MFKVHTIFTPEVIWTGDLVNDKAQLRQDMNLVYEVTNRKEPSKIKACRTVFAQGCGCASHNRPHSKVRGIRSPMQVPLWTM